MRSFVQRIKKSSVVYFYRYNFWSIYYTEIVQYALEYDFRRLHLRWRWRRRSQNGKDECETFECIFMAFWRKVVLLLKRINKIAATDKIYCIRMGTIFVRRGRMTGAAARRTLTQTAVKFPEKRKKKYHFLIILLFVWLETGVCVRDM